jgi:formylglycine-generating enzyme
MPRNPFRSAFLRRLDRLSGWQATACGLLAGGIAGFALTAALPWLAALAGFVLLLGAAAGLAWSGEPVEAMVLAVNSEPPVDLVLIPAGTFVMGSPEEEEGRWDDEGPMHAVSVSAFQCMRFPVTRRLYAAILGEDPSWPEGGADDRPVNNVSWLDAVRFCNAMSDKEGLPPCYTIEEDTVSWNRAASGYRLPTEAEWEYACRAAMQTRWSFGDEEAELERFAWFAGNSRTEPRLVGTRKPNLWGLHDMHGNVWECCWNWFGPYTKSWQTDPAGPKQGTSRVLRGGAFDLPPRGLRSAIRGRIGPEAWAWAIGFRCVRGPLPPALSP